MATSSGGAKKSTSGARKRTGAKPKPKAKAKSSRAASTRGASGRASSARKPSWPGPRAHESRPPGPSELTQGEQPRARKPRLGGALGQERAGVSRRAGAQPHRARVERHVSRERIQEVVDDAVKRGRMTRDDANELVSNLVSRGRKAADELIATSRSCSSRPARRSRPAKTATTRKQATRAAGQGLEGSRATPPSARSPRPTSCAAAPGPADRRSPVTTS